MKTDFGELTIRALLRLARTVGRSGDDGEGIAAVRVYPAASHRRGPPTPALVLVFAPSAERLPAELLADAISRQESCPALVVLDTGWSTTDDHIAIAPWSRVSYLS